MIMISNQVAVLARLPGGNCNFLARTLNLPTSKLKPSPHGGGEGSEVNCMMAETRHLSATVLSATVYSTRRRPSPGTGIKQAIYHCFRTKSEASPCSPLSRRNSVEPHPLGKAGEASSVHGRRIIPYPTRCFACLRPPPSLHPYLIHMRSKNPIPDPSYCTSVAKGTHTAVVVSGICRERREGK